MKLHGNRFKRGIVPSAFLLFGIVLGRCGDDFYCYVVEVASAKSVSGSKPAALRYVDITRRGVPFPMLQMDYIDSEAYANVPVDWLDIELFGSPTVARYYRADATDLHRTVRAAVLATLSDQQHRVAVASLINTPIPLQDRMVRSARLTIHPPGLWQWSCRDLSADLKQRSIDSASISQHEASTGNNTTRELFFTKAMTMATTSSTQGTDK